MMDRRQGPENDVIDLCDDDSDDQTAKSVPLVALPEVVSLHEHLEARRRARQARKPLQVRPDDTRQQKRAKLVTGAGSWARPLQLEGETNEEDTKKTPSSKDSWANYRILMGPLRFDVVDTRFYCEHAFLKQRPQPPIQLPVQRLFQEYTSYRTVLPVERGSSVFVRVVEDRLDLVRFLITGPEDTPYQSGCFVFDLLVGHDYPKNPPKVKFLTTGGGKVRFNPNLYADGKVCLSLLGTWDGPGWKPQESTLLQVLVSIQGLILVEDPYFNEPGFERSRGTRQGKNLSDGYNRKIRRHTLEHGILPFLGLDLHYPEFAAVIHQHYSQCSDTLQKQLVQWERTDPTLRPLADSVRVQLARLAAVSPGQEKQPAISKIPPLATSADKPITID